MILSAQSIRARGGMITPFNERAIFGGMSYGLSACGYDVRIAERVILWPGDFILASTMERFDLPHDVAGLLMDKSTWARLGVSVQNTIAEPGWRGYLTLEISNHGKEVISIPAGSPIGQMAFHLLDQPTEQPYGGKYMDQESGPQKARYEANNEDK